MKMRWLIGCAGLTILILLGVPADSFAQSSIEDKPYFGLGIRSSPEYDGAPLQQPNVIPVVRYYGRTLFVRTTQGVFEGGARAGLGPGLALGLQVAYEAGYRVSESEILRPSGPELPSLVLAGSVLAVRPMYEVDAGASIGPHIEFDKTISRVPIKVLGRLRRRVVGDSGSQVDLRFSSGIYGNQRIRMGLFVQETWANTRSMQMYYGIPVAAPGSDLPAFEAHGGRLFTAVGLMGSIDFTPKYLVLWSAEHRQLAGDAARSPLTRQTSNQYFSIGIARRLF
jgi:outer membrane scaffolding protein for murein synthesis (MipA/OmpV family)